MKEHTLAVENVVAGYGGTPVVRGVNIAVPSGKISVIIGANACGKSTLLKTMARILKPASGAVTLDGARLDRIPTKSLARILGLLPQSPIAPEGIAVSDLVGRGRYPHHSFLRGLGKEDLEIIDESLESMGIADIADRSVDELSGGQRQRVWIAMALAQQTDILLLDEPTTFLDITHQLEILELLTDINRRRGTTIVMVLHDINLAARYADHMFAMREGLLEALGAPEEVMTEEIIRRVFGLECLIVPDPVTGAPHMHPQVVVS
ncbi:MAG: ABC transporter ATP-binding protein [Oscillospiraceae bacterium]|jgi:iron complex transport system ATP-binding protein|nr:ABC transporter ATP-binding protein [Oscillospiraceae bacterium]